MMAKLFECYTNGNGKPLSGTFDVTPSWWKNKKPRAAIRVAGLLEDQHLPITSVTIGLDQVLVSIVLLRRRADDPEAGTLEGRIMQIVETLEALGAEYARQADS